MNVYWVESFDHSEDWFVVSPSERAACELFANEMGYDLIQDQVSASLVCPLAPSLNYPNPDFLDTEGVIACGGELIEFHDEDLLQHLPAETIKLVGGETRIVRIGGKVYMEGNVLRVALQLEGKIQSS